MAEEKAVRLSKVAKELNLGIQTISEFLKEKGIEIEAKPNTKIDGNAYAILLEEFRSEKLAKEESQKINLDKEEEQQTVSIKEKKEPEAAPEIEPKQEKEIIIKNVQPDAASQPEETAGKESGPKVLGKIELPQTNRKKGKTLEKPKPKEEPKTVEKKEKEEVKKVVEEKKEPPKIEFIPTEVQKLSGPTLLGKIELPKEAPRRDKKKPVASSSEGFESDGKKKRKRIRKKVDFSEGEGDHKRKRFQKHRDSKPEVTDEDVQNQIKETLARLQGTGGKSKTSKHRREKREAVSEQLQREQAAEEAQKKVLKVSEFVTVNQLATMMNVGVSDVISACMSLGIFVSINQRLDAETLTIVADEFGYDIDFVSADIQENILVEEDKPEDLVPRPPIVTVMGHVDHGKTSFLDYVRKTNVIAGESGGITQHIGAYSVELENGKKITFLDTPGHEAFTAMRARGAQVTDVAIIIIAADDNVMPQTKEAISHAQAAEVPIVFAINKIDKTGANPDRIKEELSKMNILVEDWGGKYQCQEISAKKGIGIPELLEKVLLEAELLELKANPNKNANGVVIESSLDKGRGYVTTLLIEGGTMKMGDVILAGCFSGRIKAMFNERGQKVEDGGPATPVSMLGLDGAPNAGDKFYVMDDEKEARSIAQKRLQIRREQGIRSQKHITLDEIGRRIAIGDFQELNVIVKGDVDGSIEALSDSLEKLSTEKIQVNIIHKSVGQITESDVMLAAASNAVIVGFQVRPSTNARKLAEHEQIDIRLYSVIYKCIEEIKAAMEGMLAPKIEEKITGTAEIREVFKISKVGTIAGCMMLEGIISRNDKVRVIREGVVAYTGELGSLKRFKDDVKEVKSGFECGLNIDKYNDIKVGDIIEGFTEVAVKQTL